MKKNGGKGRIRLGILDDHLSTMDGYEFRLRESEHIEVLVRAATGEELTRALKKQAVDVLILDVSVPNSPSDDTQIPLLYFIPRLIESNPGLNILVISMHNQKNLIQSVMEAGAKGYIVKDDQASIQKLGEIITSIADGGYYFSDNSFQSLFQKGQTPPTPKLPTPRQLQALSLCASRPQADSSEIAAQLNIAPSTLRNLLSDCYRRLGVKNRAGAVERARNLGLIAPQPPS